MKKRRLFLCLLFMLAVMLLPATIQAASAPGTVKLSSISAPAYNKINEELFPQPYMDSAQV